MTPLNNLANVFSSYTVNQYGKGNIDLYNRPQYKNPDGSTSTVRSMSFNDGTNEVLIPTISQDGNSLTAQQAVDTYRKTGQYLGKFDTPQQADSYAMRLHYQQQRIYNGVGSLLQL